MNRKEIHLYRVKLIKPAQNSIFAPDISPREMLLQAINEKPSKILENSTGWSIGNIVMRDENSGSFAVGRITIKTVEKYDRETGDFIDQLDDSGPHTLVFFDASIGLLGILKKSNVAATPSSISRRIAELLEGSGIIVECEVSVNVSVIPDPDDFITKLRSAYSIKKFRASFTGPNPVDADEIFQKPLSVYCQAIEADAGAVEVVGDDLNVDAAEAVTRSTAATANSASATVVGNHGEKSQRIHLKSEALVARVELESGNDEILDEISREYRKVRHD